MDILTPTKEYKSARNLVYSCQYHVIFCPKYRRKIFIGEIGTSLKNIFIDISNEYGFEILEQEVMPDHVHLILSVNPNIGIQKCVAKLKGLSAKRLRDEYPKLKSQIPCLWTNSKFVSTVGTVSLEIVKKYIEDQKNV